MLDSLPPTLRWLVLIVLTGVIIACLVLLVWPKRDNSPRKRREAQRRHEREDLARAHTSELEAVQLSADKPPYQQPEPAQPATSEHPPPGKLPGQDRLTRISRTGMDAQDRDWAEPSDAVPAVPDDHLSGGDHPATTAMPAVARPAVPGPPPPSAGPSSGESEGLVQNPPLPWNPAETRAQRRLRLERLAEAERQARRTNP